MRKPVKKEYFYLALSWVALIVISAVLLDVSIPLALFGSTLLIVWVLLLDNSPPPMG